MNNYSNAKVIFGLNTLTKVNEKRIRFYKIALEKSDDVDLILWFNKYGSHLQKANDTLYQWLERYGISRSSHYRASDLISHWDQIKDIFILSRRTALLEHCESLERNALKIYRTAVALHFIPSAAVLEVQEQIDDIEISLSTLNTLKNSHSRQLQVA